MFGKKSFSALVALMVAISIGCGTAEAQRMRLQIPFDFNVAEQTLPAGEYSLRPLRAVQSIFQLQNLDGRGAAIILTMPIYAQDHPSSVKLVFNNYDGTLFLTEMWWKDSTTGRSVRTSDSERAVAVNRHATRTELVFKR